MHEELLHILPDQDYLNDKVKNKKNRLFDGLITVNDWSENLQKAFIFKNGKLISKGSPQKNSVKNGRISETICTTYYDCSVQEYWFCYYGGSNPPFCYLAFTFTTCSFWTECNYIPDDPDQNYIEFTNGNIYNYNKENDTIIASKCDGANLAYNNSFNSDGSVYKECHGFWLANGSLLIYPQYSNSSNSSNYYPGTGDVFYYVGPNGEPKVKYKDGYGVEHTEVVQATFHTHPNSGYCGPSSADMNSAVNQQLNIPDIIIGSDGNCYKSTFQNNQYTGFTQSNGRFSYFGCN